MAAYLTWYNREKMNQLVGDFLDIIVAEHITADETFIVFVMRPKKRIALSDSTDPQESKSLSDSTDPQESKSMSCPNPKEIIEARKQAKQELKKTSSSSSVFPDMDRLDHHPLLFDTQKKQMILLPTNMFFLSKSFFDTVSLFVYLVSESLFSFSVLMHVGRQTSRDYSNRDIGWCLVERNYSMRSKRQGCINM